MYSLARRLPNLEFPPSECRSRPERIRSATMRQRFCLTASTPPLPFSPSFSVSQRGRSSLEVSKSLKRSTKQSWTARLST